MLVARWVLNESGNLAIRWEQFPPAEFISCANNASFINGTEYVAGGARIYSVAANKMGAISSLERCSLCV